MNRNKSTQGGERHNTEYQQRLAKNAKARIKQNDHQPKNQTKNEQKAGFRAPLVLELPAPLDPILVRIEFNFLCNILLSISEQRGKIASAVIELDRQVTVIHFAGYRTFAGLQYDLRDLRQRNECTAAGGEN